MATMEEVFLKILEEIQEYFDNLHLHNQCRICKKICDHLERHHIISQNRRSIVPHLVDLPGNIVLICNDCHKQTTSYIYKNIIKNKSDKKKKLNDKYWKDVKKLNLRKSLSKQQ